MSEKECDEDDCGDWTLVNGGEITLVVEPWVVGGWETVIDPVSAATSPNHHLLPV